MANYNKSFNFRNGVQVDDDNFIVNANLPPYYALAYIMRTT